MSVALDAQGRERDQAVKKSKGQVAPAPKRSNSGLVYERRRSKPRADTPAPISIQVDGSGTLVFTRRLG